jgi:hypothetical protein
MSARLWPNLGRANPAALARMRSSPCNFSDTRWAAYQNYDFDHPDFGHVQFLAVGSRNTIKAAPKFMPNTPGCFNWSYVFVGYLDLSSGEVIPI